jgi:hypothetical protein
MSPENEFRDRLQWFQTRSPCTLARATAEAGFLVCGKLALAQQARLSKHRYMDSANPGQTLLRQLNLSTRRGSIVRGDKAYQFITDSQFAAAANLLFIAISLTT